MCNDLPTEIKKLHKMNVKMAKISMFVLDIS